MILLLQLTSSAAKTTESPNQMEWNKFMQYMYHNVRYTDDAIKARIQGYSQIKFRIRSGGVEEISVVGTPLGYGLDEAVIKAMSSFDGYEDLPNGKYSLEFFFGIFGSREDFAPPVELKGHKSIGGYLRASVNLDYKPGTSTKDGEDNRLYDFIMIDTPPSFPGGPKAFQDYIKKEMNYSGNARGKVILSFIVEKDGTLTGIHVDRLLGSGADQEAFRLIKASPKWTPGIQKGKLVRVKYNIPISFNFNM